MQSAPDTPSSHCGRCGAPQCGAPLRPQDVRGFKQGCRHFPSPGGRRTHPPGITRENATLRWDLHRAVKEAFDANGISIPFPQTDMHLHVPDSGKAADHAAIPVLTGDDTKRRRDAIDYASGDQGADEPEGGGSERG